MPLTSRHPSVRSAVRRWRVLVILSLLSLPVLLGQTLPPRALATAPAGLSMGAWPAIQAHLPALPGYLKAANVDAGDDFGWAVAMDGDTMVVGAQYEDGNGSSPADNSVENAGAVYVFVRTTVDSVPTWTQQAYLKPTHPGAHDMFGSVVAIDGDTIVVGAWAEDSNGSSPSDTSAFNAGAAYVFTRTNGSWTEQAYLKAANVEAGDNFGSSVAIAGDTIVVGADGESGNGSSPDDNSAFRAGAAYVFERTGTIWTQQAYLKAANAESGDLFGASVAIAGDTLVVGALYEESDGSSPANNSARDAGAVYVFTRMTGSWTQQAYLKASNVEADDAFGFPVVVDGETLIVGAWGEDSNGSSPDDNSARDAGAVYVFGRTNGTWTEQAYLKASNAEAGDDFRRGIAIAGDTVVVGASSEDSDGSSPADNSAHVAGAAYVFTRRADSQGVPVWTQQRYLKASNVDAGDGFGISVAIVGETVVVGAIGEASDGSSPADNSAPYAGAMYVLSTRSFVYLPLLLRP